jgi:hypothetical protein
VYIDLDLRLDVDSGSTLDFVGLRLPFSVFGDAAGRVASWALELILSVTIGATAMRECPKTKLNEALFGTEKILIFTIDRDPCSGGRSRFGNKKHRVYASFCVGVFLVRGCSCHVGADSSLETTMRMHTNSAKRGSKAR